jgi:hypothetical protein
MPSYYRNPRNPKALRGEYNANAFVNAMNLDSNKSSGFIGTPMGDAEGFDKVIKSFETIENYLEAYVPAVQKLINDPIAVSAPSASDLFVAINSATRILSRISLNKLPLGDIETLQEYKARADAYVGTLTDFRDIMLGVLNAQVPVPGRPREYAQTQTDLEKLAERLSVLSQVITSQINVYNSGVSQPVKLGSGFNPSSAMYQTPTYIYPRFR